MEDEELNSNSKRPGENVNPIKVVEKKQGEKSRRQWNRNYKNKNEKGESEADQQNWRRFFEMTTGKTVQKKKKKQLRSGYKWILKRSKR